MTLNQQKRNECANLVRLGNRKINAVRIGRNESKTHQEIKKQICQRLEQAGRQFITEAIFKTGGRCDILNLDDFLAIEIVCSETEHSLADKRRKYPIGIKIGVIRMTKKIKYSDGSVEFVSNQKFRDLLDQKVEFETLDHKVQL